MYTVKKWSPSINLGSFYTLSQEKKYLNNINEQVMITELQTEPEWQGFVLMNNEEPVGYASTHGMFDYQPDAYRVLARLAIVKDVYNCIRTPRDFTKHNHLTDQFLMPACLAHVDGDAFITSNDSKVASQRLVHKLYMPSLVKLGLAEKADIKPYRGELQTFWLIYKDKFLERLQDYKWSQ